MPQAQLVETNGVNWYNKRVVIWLDAQTSISCDLNSNVRSLLSGGIRNDPVAVAAAATNWFQMQADNDPRPGRSTRVLLTDLPADEPARLADPGRPDFFWARASEQLGSGGNIVPIYHPVLLVGGIATHLIARSFLITIGWDGTAASLRIDSPPTVLR